MILSLADAANAPPALVVNENVAALEAFRATRSVKCMKKKELATMAIITVTIAEADVTENEIPAVIIVTKICLVPAEVPDLIVTINVVDVPPTSEQIASKPPTVALHGAAESCAVVTKLVPVTVMVLPA